MESILQVHKPLIAGITPSVPSPEQIQIVQMRRMYMEFLKQGAGTTNMIGNTIGSASSANSIQSGSNATSGAQLLAGIYNGGTGVISISAIRSRIL